MNRFISTPPSRLSGATVLGLALLWLFLMMLSGCAKQAVILMPDRDGHVGKAEVSTTKGKQTLDKEGDTTSVISKNFSPSSVTTAKPADIQKTFGEVLAIEPPPAETFTLFFETGTTDLTAESSEKIAAIIQSCQQRGAISVSVSGHTDATGSDQLNDQLARDRAEQVKKLLVEQGLNPDLITVSSHGKGNPAYPTPEGVAEPRNRRVVVIIH
ncbi:OmpA family protein [Leeia oryzae]|uniref:OmpA family protein n=1 Tax=Leeia oryzae TaxID=356662 RepID=UPI00037C0731|nr:OmpA family protein [Leeia oryzae]